MTFVRSPGLPGSGSAGDFGRAVELTLHQITLGWQQEHCPFLPGKYQSLFQLLDVRHQPESALGVRVLERAGFGSDRLGNLWSASRREFQQCFGCLTGEMTCHLEQRVLIRLPDISDPLQGATGRRRFCVPCSPAHEELETRRIRQSGDTL